MLEARGDLTVNSGYKGVIDVGQEDACMLLGLVRRYGGVYKYGSTLPKSAVAMASFPRPGDFGSSWASWPSGARMGLVSSTDMAATENKFNADGMGEEFRLEILWKYMY